MNSVIVADASCLIGLDNIGKLNILTKLFSEVLIPPAVRTEFGRPIAFAKVIPPADSDLVRSLGILLGAGESEAIALAIEKHAQVILDDKKARSIAEEMGLIPIGTVGILIKAKLKNFIPSLKEAIDELENVGFYVSSSIKKEALRITAEN